MTEHIYGVNSILEMLGSGRRACRKVMIAKGRSESAVRAIAEEAHRRNIPIEYVERREIDAIAGDAKHQGVVALIEGYRFSTLEEVITAALSDGQGGFVLMLDGVVDPHNMGSLIRTAHLFGAHGVIIPKDNSCPINATVVKTSAGATEYMRIACVTNLARAIDLLKQKGFWVCGAEGDGGQSIYLFDFKRNNYAIVIGSEGEGMRRLVREKCDCLFSIPMAGRVGSYNASVAGALVMGELARARWLSVHANSIPKRP
jgi:23S rRNA (guanosine2251-2'-O)-methyltransferase